MIKWLARPADYLPVWQDMQAYTSLRGADTPDEIWLCEHAPVYTLGQAGLPQHVLNPGNIPIVHCDRGGQVTYHGPGQVMAYALFDLRRVDMYVKEYVTLLEGAVIDTLTQHGVDGACRKPGAPGVYVPDPDLGPGGGELAKIAALGIKIRNGRAYHGVSLNVDMDLAPFLGINPCGYEGLRTVDMAACGVRRLPTDVGDALAHNLADAWRRRRSTL
ncbi:MULTISPECIES: lipoyl(octanoyl) transferase LipB [Achromobacter]|uniref:Octanoyltransferase n=1 Tax=Achromobacter spanius TaxID=217203 RepID=A0ABY8GNG3_9BURK|nr:MULTISPECIES: lipoyl(octanoyl) transferase LipB [Achromobacter]WAI84380.1 lipoyl(octanoyl) transferase LipB [Achromobacter spanius]WEX94463.1 lipoyl(octanoyl) transferase LipB [Achromobacter sp. SS2-2022]WFP06373.1 lipoyl(octanoyl) transferase LipB [Achromobacter spanius]